MIRQSAGSFVSAKTLLRVAVAMAAAIAVGSQLPWLGRPFLLVEAVVVPAVFVVVAILLGELSKADLATVRRGLGGKKS